VYSAKRGEVVLLMLGGGDKSTQAADISRAVKMAATLEG
jgi:putative component of toxin-antitoxin plasmid stabilization module